MLYVYMMWNAESLAKDIGVGLIATAIFGVVNYYLGGGLVTQITTITLAIIFILFVFRNRVVAFSVGTYDYLFDTKTRADIQWIDKYPVHPSQNMSRAIYEGIREEDKNVTIVEESPQSNLLRVRDETTSTILEIRIELDFNFDRDMPSPDKSKVIIETYSDIVFGYRSDQPIQRFEQIATIASESVQRICFPEQDRDQSFVRADIQSKSSAKNRPISSEKLEMNATFDTENSVMKMTFENPHVLTEGMRKWYRPLKSYS